VIRKAFENACTLLALLELLSLPSKKVQLSRYKLSPDSDLRRMSI
jgi:hypothetical protein